MRQWLLAALLILGLLPQAADASDCRQAPKRTDVTHHALRVRITPDEHLLEGVDMITFPGPMREPIEVRLNRSCEVLGVQLGPFQAEVEREGDVWGIRRKDVLGSLPRFIQVRYRCRFNDSIPNRFTTSEDPSYGILGVIGSEGALLLDEAGWYPHIGSGLATYRLNVALPGDMDAITSGKRVERRQIEGNSLSVWDVSQPTRGLSLSAAKYRIREQTEGNIAVYAYFYPQSLDLADRYIDASIRYLELYNELFGIYPFSKFAVVENFFPTGYGFPSYTLLGSRVLRLPFILQTSLGHEVAHSWWGNCVYVDENGGNWSEGLTTYVADHLYKEQEGQAAARRYRQQILRDYATLVPPEKDFPLSLFTHRYDAASRAIGYGKSAMVFHMARCRVGDAVFWEALRRVYRSKRFQTANWLDFADTLSEVSGIDQRPFFEQWVNRKGAPRIRLENVTLRRAREDWLIGGTVVQEGPVFRLDVPLVVDTGTGTIRQALEMDGRESNFTIQSDVRPKSIVLDPDVSLFRHLSYEEIPPSINSIKGSKRLIVIVDKRIPAGWYDAIRMLLSAVGQQTAPILTEAQADEKAILAHDLMIVGTPKSLQRYAGNLPGNMAFNADHVELNGTRHAGPDVSAFAVVRRAESNEGTVMLVWAGSRMALEKSAAKITHYGKYGALIYSDGVAQAKELWPVEKSPLIHRFTSDPGSSSTK